MDKASSRLESQLGWARGKGREPGELPSGHPGEKVAQVTDAGHGQGIGGLRCFPLGNEVVVFVQGVLQNFRFGLRRGCGLGSAGEEIVDVGFQFVSHKDFSTSSSLSMISLVSSHSASRRLQASRPWGVMA